MAETKQREPGMRQLVVTLLGISAVVALLLGVVNMITAPKIAENKELTRIAAMQSVLPADTYDKVEYTGENTLVSAMYQAESGWVVQASATGFSGEVQIMVGVTADGSVAGVSIVSHGETAGLGANATRPAYLEQYVGADHALAVTKDGGEIDALTGATITSRAVTDGVNAALEAVAEMQEGGSGE